MGSTSEHVLYQRKARAGTDVQSPNAMNAMRMQSLWKFSQK